MPAPTVSTLAEFRSWLAHRGRSEGTQDQYPGAVRFCYRHEDPLTPIRDRRNSSCYRHSLKTALRAWARFSDDSALRKELEDLKLPSLQRKSVRQPLSEEEWFEIQELFSKDEHIAPVMKAAIEIMMIRGLRCGDVLRLKKSEIARAIQTKRLRFIAKGERTLEYSAKPFMAQLKVLSKIDGDNEVQVWRALTGGKWSTATRLVRKTIHDFCKRLGREKGEVYAHRFRHTFVNNFLKQMKGDPRAVFFLQDAMGWASPNTARNYVARAGAEELEEIEAKVYSRRRK